jgi:hypothetical protein
VDHAAGGGPARTWASPGARWITGPKDGTVDGMSRSVIAAIAASWLLAGAASAETAWPLEVINRPLTLPASSFQAGFNLSANPGPDDTGETALFDAFPLTALAGYAFTDTVEMLATYSLTLHEFEAKGPLRAGVGIVAARGASGGKLEIVIRIDGGYDFLAERVAPVTFGPQIQYTLTPSLAIVSPGQFGNWLTVTLDNPEDAQGFEPLPIFIDLPVGLLWQASPHAFAQIDTRLATLEVRDSDTSYIGVDYVLVNLTGGYSVSNQLDVGAFLTADLEELADTLGATVFLRYYGI